MDEQADQDTEDIPEGGSGPEQHAQDTIPAPTQFDPLLGTLLDERYLLLASLGEGGMGQVYQARHVLMDKPVAVKVLHAELAHLPDLTKRFEREAQSSSRLNDPHIITVTDFGRTGDGQHYLVMELLEGESLADRIDGHGALPIALALRIAQQILKGLAHAHSQGVVHRDLKPENVMLVLQHGDETDFVKILDFGIAKLADGGSGESLTRSGVVFGTPKYLSPEQALGDEVDGRADLYAVGIILWEMLVGTPPYTGETAMDTMSLHLTGDIPRLGDHGSFPRGLQQVIVRALAKKPAERFQEAGEFLAELEAIDPEGPEERTSPSIVVETLERITSIGGGGGRRWLAPLAGAAVLLTVIAVVVFFFAGRGPAPAGPALPPPEPLDTDTRSAEERGLDLARRQIADKRTDEAVVTVREVLLKNPSSSDAHLLLGHARFMSAERAEAMDSYELALTADPAHMRDVRLTEHLRTALDWEASRSKAALLLARFGGEDGLGLMVEMSNSALFPPEKRIAAREALKESGHGDRIDWLISLTADFNQLTRCKERRQIIAEMEIVGDRGFLPLLEEFRPLTVRKGRKTTTTNPCVGPDALRAIATIESRKVGIAGQPADKSAP
jgi:tetratricopeptide (TPR) repeat protein